MLGGETLQDTKRYDLFSTYHDLFLPKNERTNEETKATEEYHQKTCEDYELMLEMQLLRMRVK